MQGSTDKKLIIFTAPSGAGKTTIVRHLMKVYPQLGFSVSVTTRAPRPHEKDGIDYHFVSIEEFREKISDNAFAEFEEVYPGQYYGTLKSEIAKLWARGMCAVFDIDVKGASSLKTIYGDACMSVFVRPPSLQILIDRLRKRNTESEASFRKRIQRVKHEMSFENRFDHVLVNDLLEVALKESEILVEDFLALEEE